MKLVLVFLLLVTLSFADDYLQGEYEVSRDDQGIAHIHTEYLNDAVYLLGYYHAVDRLFQMDVIRRQGSGKLSALLGPGGLASDKQLRLFGLEKWAAASWEVTQQFYPEEAEKLQWFVDGINARIEDILNPENTDAVLPFEYTLLSHTSVEQWTPVDVQVAIKVLNFDTVVRSKELDLSILAQTLEGTGQYDALVQSPSVGAEIPQWLSMLFDDLLRIKNLDPETPVTVDNFFENLGIPQDSNKRAASSSEVKVNERTWRKCTLNKGVRDAWDELDIGKDSGSNSWALGRERCPWRGALLGGDPHLSYRAPSTFYNIFVKSEEGDLELAGNFVPGIPLLAVGNNRKVAWGTTRSYADGTDYFLELVDGEDENGIITGVLDKDEAGVLSAQTTDITTSIIPVWDSASGGLMEPDPVAHGHAVAETHLGRVILPGTTGTLPDGSRFAISIRTFLFGPGLDLVGAIKQWDARTVDDWIQASRLIVDTPDNWVLADVFGNIGHVVTGSVPLRTDFEDTESTEPPYGDHPMFMRDGFEPSQRWVARADFADQAGDNGLYVKDWAQIPFEEMPKVENQESGLIYNSNNDPIGVTADNNALNQRTSRGTWYYFGYFFHDRRVSQLANILENSNGKPSLSKSVWKVQHDVTNSIARFIIPALVDALDNYENSNWHDEVLAALDSSLASSGVDREQLEQAAHVLRGWESRKYQTHTGVPGGYDFLDDVEEVEARTDKVREKDLLNGVATTLAEVWQQRLVENTFGRTLDPIFEAIEAATGSNRPSIRIEEIYTSRSLVHWINDFEFGPDGNTGPASSSGVSFFPTVEGATLQETREFWLVKSLVDSLELLSSSSFETAFGGSTNVLDYAWGKLHRLTVRHPLGIGFLPLPTGPVTLNIPGTQDNLPVGYSNFDQEAGLLGLSTSGQEHTVQQSGGYLLGYGTTQRYGADSEAFLNSQGAVTRYGAALRWWRIRAYSELPGGISGNPLDQEAYGDLLQDYLVGKPFRFRHV